MSRAGSASSLFLEKVNNNYTRYGESLKMAEENHAYAKTSPTAGNGLFATEDLPPGELIFSLSRPLVGVLDIPRLEDTCSNCFVWTAASLIGSRGDDAAQIEVKACTGCRTLRYCSKVCSNFHAPVDL